MSFIFNNGKKEDLQVSRTRTSIHGKVMEQLILETISKHMDKKIISQHGITKVG